MKLREIAGPTIHAAFRLVKLCGRGSQKIGCDVAFLISGFRRDGCGGGRTAEKLATIATEGNCAVELGCAS